MHKLMHNAYAELLRYINICLFILTTSYNSISSKMLFLRKDGFDKPHKLPTPPTIYSINFNKNVENCRKLCFVVNILVGAP